MNCNCCGAHIPGKWKQWWNQDNGFGICASCVKRNYRDQGETEETIRSYFGVEGVNYPGPENEEDHDQNL